MKDESQRMKECDVIQPELSAYVDGELTSHRRELVEAHLALCPQCREALAEMRTLAAGVAAMPKLQPSPRFLADVRHKIARGDNPEAPTWHDYLFRPVWIKVPLELAALIAVTVFVMRLQEQRAEPVASEQLAQAENYDKDQSLSSPMEAKNEPPTPAEATPAAQPPPPAAPESEAATAPTSQFMSPQEPAPKPENEVASSAGIAPEPGSGAYQLSDSQAKSLVAGSRLDFKPAVVSRRRVPAVTHGTGSLGIMPTPSASEVATLAKSLGVEPAKLGGVVVVHARNINDAQGRAEQLAARCNGKVFSVSPAMDSTGQIFFVELPREYAASFKLDLEQNAVSTALSTNAMVDRVVAVTNNAAPLSVTSTARVVGVLTGGVETSGLFSGTAQLALANNPRAQAAATTVLEILVVPPPLLVPTNSTPTP
jgi:hypothetical protein